MDSVYKRAVTLPSRIIWWTLEYHPTKIPFTVHTSVLRLTFMKLYKHSFPKRSVGIIFTYCCNFPLFLLLSTTLKLYRSMLASNK